MQQERLQSQQVYFFSTEVVHSNMTGGRRGAAGWGGRRSPLPALFETAADVGYCFKSSLLLIIGSAATPKDQNDALRADGMCAPRGERVSERVEGQRGSAMKAASPKIKSKAPSGGCGREKVKVRGEKEGVSSDCVAKKSGRASDAAEP